jgi:dipeptidyl aminopeptidase/acylaminoacyl peptidase
MRRLPDEARFDLDAYLALPRVAGLILSPDGTRLVAPVATVAPDGKKFVTALWELDPGGDRPPRRLTRSAPGESGAAFLPGGSLLFTSARKDPEAKPDEDGDGEEKAAIWLLPAEGGEARPVASAPAGIHAVAVARDAGTVVYATRLHPAAGTLDDEERRIKAASDAGVEAQLFEGYPIRFWDRYLGPGAPRLLAAPPPPGDDGRMEQGRQLTPAPGHALDEASFSVTPDGSTVVTTWNVDDVRNPRTRLLAIDAGSGEQRVLLDDPGASVDEVACSPDGRFAVCQHVRHGTPDSGPSLTLWLVDLATGEGRDLTPGFEPWPSAPAWAPDGSAVFFVADQDGRAPVFRVDLDGGQVGPAPGEEASGSSGDPDRPAAGATAGRVTRLAADGAYTHLCPAPDGRRLYALRSSLASPPEVVVLDTATAEQAPRPLPTPGLPLQLPGRVAEVEAAAGDGTRVRSWLVLPEGASSERPAPLVTFIHGGPLSSWNDWSWRWNPHLLAARGYAVLLPDPGLSTGYGQPYVDRGWGRWGGLPYTDLMAAVDAAAARPDVDGTRTAAMGGSFGGYMANWVAGHTDRFRCIVTHASIWSLRQFHGTTDHAAWWEREFGDPDLDECRYLDWSPDRHAARIRTPMLVIHGERDYRVPIGESLRLWTDLRRHGVDAKFLYFPDEHHWVLKPQNARVWYQTVLAFLDTHVLGKDWVRPELL